MRSESEHQATNNRRVQILFLNSFFVQFYLMNAWIFIINYLIFKTQCPDASW